MGKLLKVSDSLAGQQLKHREFLVKLALRPVTGLAIAAMENHGASADDS
jgi:hypothetical protein